MNTIFNTDCRTGLQQLQSGIVNTCVTSPPYFGLRDYGVDGQIGLEETPDQYVQKLVAVFREVRRVLKDDGTLWLNIGDTYATRGGAHGGRNDNQRGVGAKRTHDNGGGDQQARRAPEGLKPKDLIGIPWRVAFALQADGWYLRQDIIWHKPNPMPESVTDRCTKAHEYIFLLTKNERYYFDARAIAEPVASSTIARLSQPTLEHQQGSYRVPGKTNGPMKAKPPRFGGQKYGDSDAEETRTKSGNYYTVSADSLRNRRSVWTVTTKPFKGAHFATFPPDLIKPCILAGAPEGGLVLDPFMGAGTTALVASKLNRNYVGFELNPTYIQIAENRILKEIGMFKHQNTPSI